MSPTALTWPERLSWHATCVEPERALAMCTEPVELWSAEEPHVYCLILEVKDSMGTVVNVEASQVGFRQDHLCQGYLMHNSCPIMLRGVNRHEHDPITGKVRHPAQTACTCLDSRIVLYSSYLT